MYRDLRRDGNRLLATEFPTHLEHTVCIATAHSAKDAERVYRAVLTHGELVHTLETVLDHYELSGDHCHAGSPYPGDCIACNARLTLAKAKGEREWTTSELQTAEMRGLQCYAQRRNRGAR